MNLTERPTAYDQLQTLNYDRLKSPISTSDPGIIFIAVALYIKPGMVTIIASTVEGRFFQAPLTTHPHDTLAATLQAIQMSDQKRIFVSTQEAIILPPFHTQAECGQTDEIPGVHSLHRTLQTSMLGQIWHEVKPPIYWQV